EIFDLAERIEKFTGTADNPVHSSANETDALGNRLRFSQQEEGVGAPVVHDLVEVFTNIVRAGAELLGKCGSDNAGVHEGNTREIVIHPRHQLTELAADPPVLLQRIAV